MVRVTQLYSAFGSHFSNPFREKYGLVRYHDINKPVVIYGCYGWQIEKAFQNKSEVIIVWAGSDLSGASKNPDYVKRLQNSPNIHHIARSNFLANDLERMGLPYKKVPLVPHKNTEMQPCPLGDAVYIYKARLYGGEMYQRIKSEFPQYEYIETFHKAVTRAELMEYYKKSFVSFRFTRHDGLSNTAIELGLMGRKIFWNGDTPNAIHWNNFEQIKRDFETIIQEKYDPFEVAEKMKKYLDVGEDWLWV